MTSQQADLLRNLIGQLVEAARVDAFKGSADPEAVPEIEAEYKTAKIQVERLIHNLTDPPTISTP